MNRHLDPVQVAAHADQDGGDKGKGRRRAEGRPEKIRLLLPQQVPGRDAENEKSGAGEG